MNAVLYPLAAGVAWVALVYRLWRGLRQDPRDPVVYVVSTAFALMGMIFTVSTPAIWAEIDDLVSVPNLALLISQSGVILFSGTIQCLIIFWTTPRPDGWRRARWRVLWVLAVLVTMAGLFSQAEQREERPTDAAAAYAADPAYALYLACYITMVAVGVIDIIRLCLHYARNAGRTWLSRGLRITAIGAGLGLLYCVVRATTLIEAQLSTDPHRLEALIPPVAAVGAILIVVGLTLPSLGPRLSRIASWQVRQRSHQRLYPLWEAITVTLPEVVLDHEQSPTRPMLWHVDRRLSRRVVEIGDGIRQLRNHMQPSVAVAASAAAGRDGLVGDERDAISYAAQILVACVEFESARRLRFDDPAHAGDYTDQQRHTEPQRRARWEAWRAGIATTDRRLAAAQTDSENLQMPIRDSDFPAEVAWLVQVSTALRSSWIPPAIVNNRAASAQPAAGQ